MSRKASQPIARNALERLEPRILLSADLLGGAFGVDAAGDAELAHFNQLDAPQDVNHLIAPLLQQKWLEDFSLSDALPASLDIYSGAAAGLADLHALTVDDSEHGHNGGQQTDMAALLDSLDHHSGERQEIIFIDVATPDYQQLVDDIVESNSATNYLIFLLDADRDGVQQISDLLANQSGIDAIHIVSHGNEGNISLGNSQLNSGTLNQYSVALNSWQGALASDADLLIYGCHLAANADGQNLLQAMAQLTGADIAASDDQTGATALGGDWDFEYQLGIIETQLAFSQNLQHNWQGVLATFTVNTTADTIDANVGDGLALDAAGNTSLRAAIMEANFAVGADDIVLNAGTYSFGITGNDNNAALGDLDITSNITITGAGATTTIIDGAGLDRVFDLRDGNSILNLTKLTVQGGSTGGDGGGILLNSAAAQLTTNQVIISGNSADKGAGIFNKGTIALTDSVVADNIASNEGGGISNHKSADLDRVTVSGNRAQDGGGLHQDNSADNFKLTNVTVSGNTATGKGGGFYVEKSVVILNSTFTLNSADDGGGIHNKDGTVNIKNTIVAANTSADGDHDVDGNFNSLGSNLIQTTSGSSGFSVLSLDKLGSGANLGGLAANGGFGKTHALLAGSIAINPIGLLGAPAVDQTNNNRDLLPDIGAFEFDAGNSDPTLANAMSNQAATEDTAFSFQFASNSFNDADGDSLSYTAELSGGGALPGWLSFDGSTRTFSGTPTNGDVGTISIKVSADDSNGGTPATDTFDIVIANSNDDPTQDNDIPSQNATEDVAFSFQFAANVFGDVDVGDTLTYTAQLSAGGALPGWLSFDGSTRTFSGTPLNADVGTITVAIIADDGNGGTPASGTFSIAVSNANDDPTLDNAISEQHATKNTAFSFQFAANTFGDVDVGDNLTYSAQLLGGGALPGWLSFDASTRTFSGTPLNGDVGTIKVEVTADDGNGGTPATDTFDLVVKNSNLSPALANAISNQAATEDTAFNFQFAANTFSDADGDSLTYSAQLSGGGALPGWLNFDGSTRTFSGTPLNGDIGSISVEVIADDGNGGVPVTNAFDIVIANSNDDPTLNNAISDQAATEDTAFSFQFAANSFSDVDVGDSLTYSARLSGGGALPGWLNFDASTRTFSGTPLNADVGTIIVEVLADDGNGGTPATDTFNLVVGNSNDDPTTDNPIADQNAFKNSAFSFTFAANTFADVDAADTLTYTAQLASGGALPGWLSFDGNTRTFSGTPGNGDLGSIAVKVIADDGNGGTPATDSFDLQVHDSNVDPALTNAIASQVATEDVAYSFSFVANTFTDGDGDSLTYSAGLVGGGALPGWLSFDSGTRTFSGTPLNADVGSVVVEVSADDGKGVPATTSFTILVNNSNDDPTLVNAISNQSATENTAFNFAFGANTFSDQDVGDTLAYTAKLSGGGALPAWLSFDASSGSFSGTPSQADVGTVSVTVFADDGKGGVPASSRFNITVASNNADPALNSGIGDQSALEDTAFSFSFAANSFSDADGDSLSYSASLAGGGALPAWLSFDADSRTFSGTPLQSDVGTLSIAVNADDGHGGTPATTSFNLIINNQNDSPSGAVWINGDVSLGKTLSAANNLADEDGMGVLSYQWQRNGVDIVGATGSSYLLSSADIAANLSVEVSYTDGQGALESRVSGAVVLAGDIGVQPGSSSSSTNSSSPAVTAPASNIADTETAEQTETQQAAAKKTEDAVEESAPRAQLEQSILAEHLIGVTPSNGGASAQVQAQDEINTGVIASVDRLPESTRLAIDFDSYLSVAADASLVSSIQYSFTPFSDPTALVNTQDFIRGIDQLRDDVAQQSKLSKTFVGSSFAISASMSAGYVVWLARSGVLLSGVLSALPAWRFIDPLPVLANSGGAAGEDDESLESLVDGEKDADVEN